MKTHRRGVRFDARAMLASLTCLVMAACGRPDEGSRVRLQSNIFVTEEAARAQKAEADKEKAATDGEQRGLQSSAQAVDAYSQGLRSGVESGDKQTTAYKDGQASGMAQGVAQGDANVDAFHAGQVSAFDLASKAQAEADARARDNLLLAALLATVVFIVCAVSLSFIAWRMGWFTHASQPRMQLSQATQQQVEPQPSASSSPQIVFVVPYEAQATEWVSIIVRQYPSYTPNMVRRLVKTGLARIERHSDVPLIDPPDDS